MELHNSFLLIVCVIGSSIGSECICFQRIAIDSTMNKSSLNGYQLESQKVFAIYRLIFYLFHYIFDVHEWVLSKIDNEKEFLSLNATHKPAVYLARSRIFLRQFIILRGDAKKVIPCRDVSIFLQFFAPRAALVFNRTFWSNGKKYINVKQQFLITSVRLIIFLITTTSTFPRGCCSQLCSLSRQYSRMYTAQNSRYKTRDNYALVCYLFMYTLSV